MSKFATTIASATFLLAGTASAAQLSYGTYFKSTHNIIADAVQPYFDQVSKQTDGSLNFKLLTDGTVVGASTTAKGVQQGLVDMGTIIPIYASSTFPMTALFSSLPLFQTDSLIETGVVNELFFVDCEECQAEWTNAKITPLALYGSSPYYLQCTKPINKIGDLEGKRIQGSGEFGAMATALGGLPMSLTATEFYTGMNQGTLDCVIGTVAWLDTYGLKDVVKYVVDVPLGVYRPVIFLDMNTKKWDKLSAEEQQAMIDGLPEAVANAAYGYVEEDETSRKNGKDAGIQFAQPFDGFMDAFAKVGEEGGDRFVELAKKNGMKDPQALLDRYLELEKEWTEIVANAKTKADYETALRERIFSQVKWPTK